ncbi:MAG: S8 family serine peptidase [Bacillota bacterium]
MRMLRWVAVGLVLVALTAGYCPRAHCAATTDKPTTSPATGRVLVKLKPHVPGMAASLEVGGRMALLQRMLGRHAAAMEQVLRRMRLELTAARIRPASGSRGFVSLQVPPGMTTQEFLARLSRCPEVEVASPVFRRRALTGGVPRDTLAPPASGVARAARAAVAGGEVAGAVPAKAAGAAGGASPTDPYLGEQWWLDAIGAPAAWAYARGAGVVVAVVDSGVDTSHPDLVTPVSRILAGYDATRDVPMTACADPLRHGTRVALVIAAGANGLGGVGVAPEALILPVKVLDDQGWGEDDDIVEGILWAAGQGARVINLSLGGPGEPSAAMRAAVEEVVAQGVALVAASGNRSLAVQQGYRGESGWRVMEPASVPAAVAVGAVDRNGTRWVTASDGSCCGPEMDICAPGVDIPVADRTMFGWTVFSASGTSFAAPQVSGALALLLALQPGLGPRLAEWLLEASAHDPGDPGWDGQHGYGCLDLGAAVALSLGAGTPAGDEAEPANDAASGAPALLPGGEQGHLELPGDADYFCFVLANPARVRLTAVPPADADAVLELFSATAGTAPAPPGGDDGLPRLQVADEGYLGAAEAIDSGAELPAGTYYVGVTECYGHWTPNPYRLGLAVAGTLVVDVHLAARPAADFATVSVVPQPPAGAQVPGQAGTTGEAVEAAVGERGRAIVTGLPDGQYRVTVSAPGHVTLGCEVELAGGFLSAAEGALTCQGTGDAAWHGPPNQVTCSLAYGDLDGDGLVRLRDLVVLARRLSATRTPDGPGAPGAGSGGSGGGTGGSGGGDVGPWDDAWDADGDGVVGPADLAWLVRSAGPVVRLTFR